MKDGKTLINQSVRAIEASPKTSPTVAGPPNSKPEKPRADEAALVDAINQVFTLFRINYHNQYHAAFSDTQLLNQAKRLWLEGLKRFSPQQVLLGARNVIEDSEYLPSLKRMIVACENSLTAQGIPSARNAYLEACCAPSPKANHRWSHPVVYHAGRETGWHTLAQAPQSVSFPLYEKHYRELIKQLLEGREFTVEPQPALEEKPHRPDKKTARQQLATLRKVLGNP